MKFTRIALALLALTTFSARAEIVALEFTGHITSVDFGLMDELSVGDSFSGTYRYDTSSAISGPYYATGREYNNATIAASLFIDGKSLVGSGGMLPFGPIYVTNDPDTTDRLQLQGNGLSGAAIGIYDSANFMLWLSTAWQIDALPSTDLPLSATDLALFVDTLFVGNFSSSQGGNSQIYGVIDSISFVPVPEPHGIALLGVAMAALLAVRRRRA